MVRIARQARCEKSTKIDCQTRRERGPHHQCEEMGGAAGEAFLGAQGGSASLSERQEVLAILVEGKMNMQKTVPVDFQRQVLEQVRVKYGYVGSGPQMMRRGYVAMKNGRQLDRNSKKDTGKKESHRSGPSKEHAKLMRKWQRITLGFLRRVISPVVGMGGVTLSYVCPHCNSFPLEGYIWWVSTGLGDGNHRKKKYCAVCWRQIRMESAQQDTGGAARYQCQ